MNPEDKQMLNNEAKNLCTAMIDLCTSMILLYNKFISPISIMEKIKWEKQLDHWLSHKKIL
mgnify:CR=1 FL=1